MGKIFPEVRPAALIMVVMRGGDRVSLPMASTCAMFDLAETAVLGQINHQEKNKNEQYHALHLVLFIPAWQRLSVSR
jgi:hypothetical protein